MLNITPLQPLFAARIEGIDAAREVPAPVMAALRDALGDDMDIMIDLHGPPWMTPGDAAQLAAIRHALAWGSRRAWIQAAVIGEPADYDGGVGLRAANGRLRSSVPALSLAARQMRDVRPGSPP